MNIIESLLVQEESKTLEFKENLTSLPSVIKTIIAFANTAGGTLLIGITDKEKKVVGLSDVLGDEMRLANAIADSIKPAIIPDIQIQTYRKKDLIIITVPHLVGPYYLRAKGPQDGVFVRVGSTSRTASIEMLKQLHSYAENRTFDELPCASESKNDLDWEAIKQAFQHNGKAITNQRAEDLHLLTSIGSPCLTNGGVILFGRNRERKFPDAVIRCIRFLGTTRSKSLDHITITSYPVLALEEAIKFVERNTSKKSSFGRKERIDTPQYPPEAVREAIINAIIHSDYTLTGINITIAIYDDFMEITNPGGMPLGMTVERALIGSSRVRNRVIAKVFRSLNLIETWGSGLKRIIEACAAYNLDAPKFADHDTEFRVTLYATQRTKPHFDKNQQAFIAHFTLHERISTTEAAEFWGISSRAALVRLKELVTAGVLKKIGLSSKDPRGIYVIVRQPEGLYP